jgi:hypothetical protein
MASVPANRETNHLDLASSETSSVDDCPVASAAAEPVVVGRTGRWERDDGFRTFFPRMQWLRMRLLSAVLGLPRSSAITKAKPLAGGAIAPGKWSKRSNGRMAVIGETPLIDFLFGSDRTIDGIALTEATCGVVHGGRGR